MIRTTTSSDASAIRGVLAEAFVSDPMLRWIFPDDETRLDATAAWLGLFAERYARDGRVDAIADDDLAAVALWRLPDAGTPPPSLPSISGLLAALIGKGRADTIWKSLRAIATVTPTGRFAYLHLLAVRPTRQRQGLGRSVIEPGLAFADETGLGVHLETTNPENLGFYQSLGFAVSNQLVFGAGGPPLWAMWRDPR
ncbi:MAG: GNAT family N-acetyltransferase [Acidimicrobiales bacterium]